MSVGLRVENIKKVYDKNIALNGVSLDIRPGEFVCLLGPSDAENLHFSGL